MLRGREQIRWELRELTLGLGKYSWFSMTSKISGGFVQRSLVRWNEMFLDYLIKGANSSSVGERPMI